MEKRFKTLAALSAAAFLTGCEKPDVPSTEKEGAQSICFENPQRTARFLNDSIITEPPQVVCLK